MSVRQIETSRAARTARGSASLVLLLGMTVVGAVPARADGPAEPTPSCAAGSAGGPAGDTPHVRLRPGGAGGLDPNDLTADQAARREGAVSSAYAERIGVAPMAVGRMSIVVPVVVHVIARDRTRAGGNIPQSMINKQLKVLNDSFGGRTRGAVTPFTFRLKRVNRMVRPAWSPIVIDSSTERQMKQTLRVGGNDVLNLYTGLLDNSILGWATFPDRRLDPYDGVVVLAESLPGGTAAPYNLGDTAVHEVGHWLDLYHTFQGGCPGRGDMVDDTPAEASPTFDCPVGRDSCPDRPDTDPVHNFMDYSPDGCLHEFTVGQVTRMVRAWRALRAPRLVHRGAWSPLKVIAPGPGNAKQRNMPVLKSIDHM